MIKESATSRFQLSLHNPNDFTLTFELVPSRGGRSKEHSRTLCFARNAAEDGRLQAVSITENAGGHPALSPEVLGIEIIKMGLDAIIHFSCKDKNRNQMESQLFAWDRQNLRNLLVITGDYPKKGYRGFPKPVFDLGSIHALDLLQRMNQGILGDSKKSAASMLIQPTSFCRGVAVSPFKHLEAELMMQYFKLHRKVVGGADFVITQVGFDVRKFHELLLYMQLNQLNIPVLGNVFVPNLTVTELMYRGDIPGCVIPEALYRDIRQEAKSQDKGKKARLVRAAKLLSVLKGMGYDGAHIGGPGLSFEDLDFLLNQAEQIAECWRDFIPELSYWPENAFYYFAKDEDSGLNLSMPTGRAAGDRTSVAYSLALRAHSLLFSDRGLLCDAMKKTCLTLHDGRMGRVLANTEHIIKFLLFECQNCGDCTLADLAFLCPQSGCAKYLFNGACGGSRDGWCEVYPGKKRCLYVRIYERLKSHGNEETMKKGFIPPRDWSLNNTSSWVNFYLGRDHAGKKS